MVSYLLIKDRTDIVNLVHRFFNYCSYLEFDVPGTFKRKKDIKDGII